MQGQLHTRNRRPPHLHVKICLDFSTCIQDYLYICIILRRGVVILIIDCEGCAHGSQRSSISRRLPRLFHTPASHPPLAVIHMAFYTASRTNRRPRRRVFRRGCGGPLGRFLEGNAGILHPESRRMEQEQGEFYPRGCRMHMRSSDVASRDFLEVWREQTEQTGVSHSCKKRDSTTRGIIQFP
jgi:hypothetical protein